MQAPQPANSTRAESLANRVPWSLLIFLVACLVFGFKLGAEPHFMDESAYVAQSFYADLLLSGNFNDPAWLEYAGYDLPPLPKYLIGIALKIGGFPRPAQLTALAWYGNPGKQLFSGAVLTVARIPNVLIGALGCVAIYHLGRFSFNRLTGIIASLLLILSPLYWLHARRAMSDVPAEAFMLASLALALPIWSAFVAGRGNWKQAFLLAFGGGSLVGLAVLSKLNGTIAGMILAGWMVLAWCLPGISRRNKLTITFATVGAGVISILLFVALNPFLYAHPSGPIRTDLQPVAARGFVERLQAIKDHRVGVSANALKQFPDDALITSADKISAVAVQGFGRFSPFGPRHSDSRKRFEFAQDWGAIIWLPLVCIGAVIAFVRGRAAIRSGEPPVTWAILVGTMIALVAVTSFIPLAWDRYYISIQPWSVLLAAAAIATPLTRFIRLESN